MFQRRTWLTTLGTWLLLALSMALGTIVTEIVVYATGAWPPKLPDDLVGGHAPNASITSPAASPGGRRSF